MIKKRVWIYLFMLVLMSFSVSAQGKEPELILLLIFMFIMIFAIVNHKGKKKAEDNKLESGKKDFKHSSKPQNKSVSRKSSNKIKKDVYDEQKHVKKLDRDIEKEKKIEEKLIRLNHAILLIEQSIKKKALPDKIYRRRVNTLKRLIEKRDELVKSNIEHISNVEKQREKQIMVKQNELMRNFDKIINESPELLKKSNLFAELAEKIKESGEDIKKLILSQEQCDKLNDQEKKLINKRGEDWVIDDPDRFLKELNKGILTSILQFDPKMLDKMGSIEDLKHKEKILETAVEHKVDIPELDKILADNDKIVKENMGIQESIDTIDREKQDNLRVRDAFVDKLDEDLKTERELMDQL